jgi:hypothetical protein
MKKSLTGAVLLLAGAIVAHSQGTVNFQNYGSGAYVYVTLNGTKIGGAATGPAPVATPAGATADIGNGDDWTAALYGAGGTVASSSGLSPLSTALTGGTLVEAPLADGVSDALVGTWYSGAAGVISGSFNGQTATVAVAAWYNAGGTLTSEAAAAAAGVPAGFSSLQPVTLGGGFSGATPPPPGFPANLPAVGAVGLSTIPEPSTIALGVMGASAFLMRLRRK